MLEQLSLFQLLKKHKSISVKLKSKSVKPKTSPNEFTFSGHNVEIVRRSYQRSLSVLVRPNGKVRVTCAKMTTKKSLLKFLNEHENWLKKALADQKKIRDKYPPKKYIQGEEFLFMGASAHLNFSPSTFKKYQISVSADQLNVFVPSENWEPGYSQKKHPELEAKIIKFYKDTGKRLLRSRLDYFSEKMQLKPVRVSFRSQKTRWGSCSSAGNITLNWRLIAAPIEVQEYVIVHELAHLKHQDHSKTFWNLVKQYTPNMEAHKKWLRDHQFELDFLSESSELHQ